MRIIAFRSTCSRRLSVAILLPVAHRVLLPEKTKGGGGGYWARTSDPQLVELVLSQLS